jgi:glycosyltransferase involved in cell wall biosynthesis
LITSRTFSEFKRKLLKMHKTPQDHHAHRLDLSIIVPAFKPEQYLVRFIERICEVDKVFYDKQIFAELIFIHNGVDNEVAESIIAAFERLDSISYNCLSYQQKLTPGMARNIGLEASSGEYLFFHDVDDLFNLDFVESLPKLIKSDLSCENQYDYIIFNYRKIKNGVGELINHGSQNHNGEINLKSLFDYLAQYMDEPHVYTFFVHCWAKLYRRSFLIEHQITFNEKMDQLEDVNFNFQLLMERPKIYYVNKTAYDYYIGQNNSNLSSNSGTNGKHDIKAVIKSLSIVKTFLLRSGFDQKEVKHKTRHLYATTYVLWMLRVGKRFQSIFKLHSILKSYINSPIVQSSMRYYKYIPQTSWLLPKLLLYKSNILMTIFLYFKTKG